MGMSDRQGRWLQQLSQALSGLGCRSARAFQIGTALLVGGVVGGVLLGLDHVSWPSALIGGLIAAVPALLMGCVAQKLGEALAQSNGRLELLDADDELSGVGNRRQFLRLAERDWVRCRRYGDEGAMLLIDADYLRRINDTMGRRCGDAVLLEVTRRVNATLRQSDVLARFSDAALAVFLPHTDPLGALDAAERIRQQVASSPFCWNKARLVVTVSVGVAHVHAGQLALEGLIQETEAALRAAKEAGRNCVRAAPIQPRQSDPSRSVAPG